MCVCVVNPLLVCMIPRLCESRSNVCTHRTTYHTTHHHHNKSHQPTLPRTCAVSVVCVVCVCCVVVCVCVCGCVCVVCVVGDLGGVCGTTVC